MKFNLTSLEIVVFLLVCPASYIWTKRGRRLRRWWHDFFRQRRSTRSLRPKSPAECPQCDRDCSLFPHRHKLEVLPWAEHKSCRGHLETVDTSGHACLKPLDDYFAISDPTIPALVSNGRRGRQRILYCESQACGAAALAHPCIGWRRRWHVPPCLKGSTSPPPAASSDITTPASLAGLNAVASTANGCMSDCSTVLCPSATCSWMNW